MPVVRVDNTPATFSFADSNPLSDGMAQFAASVVNAGPAAAAIRRQREQDSVANGLRMRDADRADRALDLQEAWRGQQNDLEMAKAGVYQGDSQELGDLARQVRLAAANRQQMDQAGIDRQNRALDLQEAYHKAQITNMQADNARATLGQFGDGLNEAIKRGVDIAKLFKPGSASQPRVFKAADASGKERFYAIGADGMMRELPMQQAVPGAIPTPGSAPAGAVPGPGQPTPSSQTVSVRQRTPAELQMLEKQMAERFPVAETRGVKTLRQLQARAMALPEGSPQRQQVLAQAQRLARAFTDAKRGVPDAIEAVLAWDAAQPDFQQQREADTHFVDEMEAGLGAMR